MANLRILVVVLLLQASLIRASPCTDLHDRSIPPLDAVCEGIFFTGLLKKEGGECNGACSTADADVCCERVARRFLGGERVERRFLPDACCDPGQSHETGVCQDCQAGKAAWKDKDSGKQKCQFCDPCKKAYSEAKSVTCSMCGATPGEFWQLDRENMIGKCLKCATGSVAKAMDPADVILLINKGDEKTLFTAPGQNIKKKCGITFKDEPCHDCDASAGQYSNEFGQSECKICPNGKAVSEILASPMNQPNSCQIYQQTFDGWKTNDETNDGGVQTCPECTRFTERCADANYCTDCPSGKAGIKGRCAPCKAGQFQDSIAQLTCNVCAAGRYQNETGATDCKECPAGKSNSWTGGRGINYCSDCEPGQYQGSPGMSSCDACGIGQSQPTDGQTACVECVVGKSAPRTGFDEW